jgi:hypothetical protein
MLNMLRTSAAYVGKGIAEHAYDGCVVSGEHFLERLASLITEVDAGNDFNNASTVLDDPDKDGCTSADSDHTNLGG